MKRTVSVIHEGTTTEIQWSEREPADGQIQGFVHIDQEGNLIVPFVNPVTERPYVFVLSHDPEYVGIYDGEDATAQLDPDLRRWGLDLPDGP